MIDMFLNKANNSDVKNDPTVMDNKRIDDRQPPHLPPSANLTQDN